MARATSYVCEADSEMHSKQYVLDRKSRQFYFISTNSSRTGPLSQSFLLFCYFFVDISYILISFLVTPSYPKNRIRYSEIQTTYIRPGQICSQRFRLHSLCWYQSVCVRLRRRQRRLQFRKLYFFRSQRAAEKI